MLEVTSLEMVHGTLGTMFILGATDNTIGKMQTDLQVVCNCDSNTWNGVARGDATLG